MSYQVLARKWRPRRFEELVGQAHVVRALVNALDSGRLHHAYLFTGTRGVGKTTLARILARALNCEAGVSSSPCGTCNVCMEIDEGRFVDLIEVDAASRTKVDETRELLENVQYAPTRARYKIYLIDEVHMFSNHSFNALLKTLEEPPPHVKFLLATTDPKKLPVTILSRCLQFNLKTIPVGEIEAQLRDIAQSEDIEAEPAALRLIAVAADGSLRDALSLLDQAIAYGGGTLREADVSAMLGAVGGAQIFDLLDHLARQDAAALIRQARHMRSFACDFNQALADLLTQLQNIAIHHVLNAEEAAEPVTAVDETDPRIARLAEQISAEDCQLFYQIGLLGRRDLAYAPDPGSGFEMTLLRMLAFRPAAAAQVLPQAPPGQGESQARAGGGAVKRKAGAAKRAVGAGADDWRAMIDAMGLQGLERELAGNCILESVGERVVILALMPELAQMRNDKIERRLADRLSSHLGRTVKLELKLAGAPEHETPVQMKNREERERDAEAARAIETDPNVQALCERFDARVEQTQRR